MPLPVSGCPYCGKLMWVKDEAIEWLDPQTIRFPCPHCHALVRRKMVNVGATAAGPIKPS
ncbi:MAG: hypothetical protein E6K60_03675 [Nitrospirae bacterium]|nr:MAG: hypothetical protein E6K60_03675 [Nitrospirota bacterium]